MRKRSRIVALALAVGCSGFLAFSACSDDATVPSVDAGADGSTDAPALDAANDAPPNDATATDAGPTATLTVVVENRTKTPAVPIAGADVVFYDTNGDVVTKKTASDGKATATMHDGASITVVRGNEYPDYVEITSVLEVGLGETIAITDEPIGLAPDAQLALSADPPPLANGVEYRFFSGQGASGGHFVPNTYTTLTGYPLVDGTGFRFLGFAPASFAPIIDPTKYAVCTAPKNPDGGVTSCNVQTSDWGNVTPGPIALTGTAQVGPTKWVWELGQANGVGLYPMIHVDVAPASAALPPSYGRVPTSVAADVYVDGTLYFPGGKTSRVQRAPNTGTIAEDLSSYLPMITGATVSGPLDAPTIAFTTSAALPASFVGSHGIGGSASIDGGTRDTQWNVLYRGTSTSVTPPKLPAALAAYLPTTWTDVSVSAFASQQLDWAKERLNPAVHHRHVTRWRWSYPQTPFDARIVTFTK